MNQLSRIVHSGMLCVVASLLFGMHAAHAQSQTFHSEPADPPYDGLAEYGAGVAVSGRTAAIGAPNFGPLVDSDSPQYVPPWLGLVNVYTADANRTHWTLLAILHADDALQANEEFGKALAMQGPRLVIATNATLRVYEKRRGTYELLDVAALTDATIPQSTPIQYVQNVLAIKVLENAGTYGVRVFRINERGKATLVAALSPPTDPEQLGYGFGGLSVDADAGTLAVGQPIANGGGHVYFYQPHGGTWVLKETVTAPNPSAAGFGSAIALSGKRLVIGAPEEDEVYDPDGPGIGNAGAVYAYRLEHGRWVQVQRLATNNPALPSFGLVEFGNEIVTNGHAVWITAPLNQDQYYTTTQTGPASLYRWNAGQLEFVARGPLSLPAGGIDMSGRYVIEGDILEDSFHSLDGAHITDLRALVPADAGLEESSGTDSP